MSKLTAKKTPGKRKCTDQNNKTVVKKNKACVNTKL